MDTAPATSNASNQFLSLPPELHAEIFQYLGFPPVSVDIPPEYAALAALERTCRLAQEITEPFLYHKIYTNVRTHGRSMGTPWKTDPTKQENSDGVLGTAELVDLLERRPRLLKVVHYLVIDEHDPVQFRRLLRLRLESLESIICQHEGPVTPMLSSSVDDPDAWVESQNKLTNSLCFSPLPTMMLLSCVTATTRIRLCYLDLTFLEDLEANYFKHSNLNELILENCKYSFLGLTRLLQPSQSLAKLHLHFNNQSPFTRDEERALIPTLQSMAGKTLKILKFVWRNTYPKAEDWKGWEFHQFESLRYLHVSPYFLFPIKWDSPILEFFPRILPPRLKVLGFEGMIPINHPGRRHGLGLRLSQGDMGLLEGLVRYKADGNVPSFRHFLIFYAEGLAGIPQALVKKAAEQDITLGFLESQDHSHLDNLNMEWLEGEHVHNGDESEDEDDEDEDDGE
ncbi:hypothetical protein PRZ48_011699 [Zasmidium cellare]|uniref:F-box domain-containing protein n=1 Tax=Zasmidium cellare TaxID=395010 RepID=A0ABR0E7F3_ZASCE|nr:hypothetical protein PRZ48_011699 [Zasmidium cellare]